MAENGTNEAKQDSSRKSSLFWLLFWSVLKAFSIFIIIVIIIDSLKLLGIFSEAFTLVNNYLQLILISWPAVVLILGILLLLLHPDAIDDLIRRIKKLGTGGVELTPPQQSEEDRAQLKEQVANLSVEAESTGKKKDEKMENLEKELEARTKTAIFERTYRLIFGGQLKILNLGFYSPTGDIGISEAYQVYSEAIKQYPTIASYPFDKYIGFMLDGGLLIQIGAGNRLQITPIGREFFNYLLTNNIITVKAF